MNRTILIAAIGLALVIFGLKVFEYQFLNRNIPTGLYIAVLLSLALSLGLWLGRQFFKKEKVVAGPPISDALDRERLLHFGLSPREVDILELIAQGHSNQEIADRLFVSLSTVKTHAYRMYGKLEVKNRTQAILKAKSLSSKASY